MELREAPRFPHGLGVLHQQLDWAELAGQLRTLCVLLLTHLLCLLPGTGTAPQST